LQFGLVISVLLHAAILGWTLISIHSQRQLVAPEPEPVAVGMVAPGEVTKLRLGSRTAKLLEAEAKESPKGEVAKKEAPKAKVAAAAAPAPPTPPPPEKTPEKTPDPPAPAPLPPAPAAEAPKKLEAEQQKERDRQAAEKLKADEQRKADEQKQADEALKAAEEQKRLEEQKRAEEQKRLEELRRQAELKKKRDEEKKRREAELKKKREEEKKRQEAEAAKQKQKTFEEYMAEQKALLNKDPRAGAPPPPSAPPDQPTKAKGPALGAAEGRDKQISASEVAMLNGIIGSRLQACWKLPSAGGGSDTPTVTLRWRLKPDGTLDGEPVVVGQLRGDPLFQLAVDAAVRAVRECAPFPLPPEKYNAWRNIERDFDPVSMMR